MVSAEASNRNTATNNTLTNSVPVLPLSTLIKQGGKFDIKDLVSLIKQSAKESATGQPGLQTSILSAMEAAGCHPFDIAHIRSIFESIAAESNSSDETESAIPKQPLPSDTNTMLSTLGKLTANTSTEKLQAIFGTDIPANAYQQLKSDLKADRFSIPAVEFASNMPDNVLAAYDNSSQKILLSANIAQSASPDQIKRLISEEFGHHVDHLLRQQYSKLGGDARQDEGARFAREVAGCKVSNVDIALDGKIGNLELHNESGHYFTTLMVAKLASTLDLSDAEQERLALFSQLPDEIGAWDAINVQAAKELKGPLFFGLFRTMRDGSGTPVTKKGDHLPDNANEYRNAVHRLGHSLVGDQNVDPLKWRQHLRDTMKAVWQSDLPREDKIAMLGLLTHTFQDSYAHMKESSRAEVVPNNEAASDAMGDARSWPTKNGTLHEWTGEYFADELGHLFSWKSPDQIHQNVRMWEAMSHDLLQTYMEAGNPDAAKQQDMAKPHNSLVENTLAVTNDITAAVTRHTIEKTKYNPYIERDEKEMVVENDTISNVTQMIMYQRVYNDLKGKSDAERIQIQDNYEYYQDGDGYGLDREMKKFYPGRFESSLLHTGLSLGNKHTNSLLVDDASGNKPGATLNNVQNDIDNMKKPGLPAPSGLESLNEKDALRLYNQFLSTMSNTDWKQLAKGEHKIDTGFENKKSAPWE